MTEVVKEYAEAIFALACEEGREEEFDAALDGILVTFNENPQLYELLVCPGISLGERCSVIEQVFSGDHHRHIVSLLCLLCERGHIKSFEKCREEFARLLSVRRGIVTARVISAVELTDAQLEALKIRLSEISGKTVELETQVSHELIGGVVVEMDGKLYDGSLRAKLHKVKEVIGK